MRPRLLAGIAGFAYLVVAVVLAATPPVEHELDTINYVSDGGFVVALVAAAPVLVALARAVGARGWALVAAAGQLALAAGVTVEMVLGHEPAWFTAVGVGGNALAFTGTVAVAVRGRRTGGLPLPLAVLLGLSVPVGVGMAGIGGSIVPAAFWLAVASGATAVGTARRSPDAGRRASRHPAARQLAPRRAAGR